MQIGAAIFYLLALIDLILEWGFKIDTTTPFVGEHYEWFPLALGMIGLIFEKAHKEQLKAEEKPKKAKKTKKKKKTSDSKKSKTTKTTKKTKKTSKS